jgi:putative transposase
VLWTTFSSKGFGEPSNTSGLPPRHLYLRAYADGRELHDGLGNYFRFYNQVRKHQSLDYQTPAGWYERGVEGEKSAISPMNATRLN